MRRTLPRTLAASLLLAVALPATAGVTIGFDVETLNEVLPALSASEIAVPISESRSVSVFLENMQVTGLDPTAVEGTSGHILTSMRVRVPQLGLDLPVQPKISLHVTERQSTSLLELRFEEAEIPMVVGSIDVAPFLPPLRFPAESLWLVAGAEGDVRVRSRLSTIEMGRKVVRFEFDLETVPGK
jgi:hypothetical protein